MVAEPLPRALWVDWLLVRHPAVQVPPGWCYGRSDVALRQPIEPEPAVIWRPVADVLAQARAQGAAPPIVCSSPARRAHTLARALAAWAQQPVTLDARWQELDFGQWEGRAWADIPRTESDPWTEQWWHRAPPGGESPAQLSQRVQQALDEPAPRTEPETRLVVTHAGPIRAALALALQLPPQQWPPVQLDFGRLTWLRADLRAPAHARWQVRCLNR